MATLSIDDDAVGHMAIRDDGRAVGTVRIDGVNAAGVQLKNKEARDSRPRNSVLRRFEWRSRHDVPLFKAERRQARQGRWRRQAGQGRLVKPATTTPAQP